MRARILTPTPETLALAGQALARAEIVGMPTETVYGLAGAVFLPEALARVFDAKERPTFDPLIVHVGLNGKGLFELERLRLIDGSRLSDVARARAQALILRFWPGPLTLVLPKHRDVPELATSGLDTVALRMPAHPVAQALIAATGQPLAAPSANRFGRISPTSAADVLQELGDRIDLILDGGPCSVGVESTVIRVEENGGLTQLRPGGLARADIEAAAGCPVAVVGSSSRPEPAGGARHSPGPQAAPGMLESHYAPVRPMILLPSALPQLEPRHWEGIVRAAEAARGADPVATPPRAAFLLQRGEATAAESLARAALAAAAQAGIADESGAHFQASGAMGGFVQVAAAASLSRDGDLHEAARSLFARMRELDASGATVIFAEPCVADRGLGHAIADRLGRACRSRLGH